MEDTWEGRHALLSYTALVATQAQPLVSLATRTCMWTHCGQKMITDWLPCSTRNKLHACMYTTICVHYQCINSGRSAEAPQAHLYTTRPSCITTYLPVACENVRHKQLHAGQPSGMGAARLHAKHSLLPPAHLIILPLAQVE